METMLAPEVEGGIKLVNDKKQTTFAKDAPKIARYSLADSTETTDSGMDYHIQIITNEDKLRVLKFLRRFFFRDEPLNHSIQLIPEGEDSTCIELEEYCSATPIENNMSFMAVSTSGAIIGVVLNGKMDPPSADPNEEPEYIKTCADPKFKKILRLLENVDIQVNRDGKFRGLNVLEIRILSVDSNWRGKGIGKALMEKTIEVGREKGYHVARADCTSFFSGRLCARLGFEPIYELNYRDYMDEDGNPIFAPAYPHTAIISYIKKL